VHLSKSCFIDASCTFLGCPDERGRGVDLYWLKWGNEIKKEHKPQEAKAVFKDPAVSMPNKKEEMKKSSLCVIV